MRSELHCLTADEMVPLRLGTLSSKNYLQGMFRSDPNYILFHKNNAVASSTVKTNQLAFLS